MGTVIKAIKTDDDYQNALARLADLMDAEPGSPEESELEVLSILIEKYEDDNFPIDLPDPVSAILFRIEQMGKKPRDLVPILGSLPRVSEILNGKRELTLEMIQSLNKEFGIPLASLMNKSVAKIGISGSEGLDFAKFPAKEIIKRKWAASINDLKQSINRILPDKYLSRNLLVYHRVGKNADIDASGYPLIAWQLRVMEIAAQNKLKNSYEPIDDDFIRKVIGLSCLERGPSLVREYLNNFGIHFIVLNHLPKTKLDGAALFGKDDNPIVALTLRYDRLDHFWHCLVHELVHVSRHLGQGESRVFIDNLDIASTEEIEKQTEEITQNLLISGDIWENSKARETKHPKDVYIMAKKLKISPAIIAGKIRHENQNFKILGRLVGQGKVRKHFPNALAGE